MASLLSLIIGWLNDDGNTRYDNWNHMADKISSSYSSQDMQKKEEKTRFPIFFSKKTPVT